jgi:hypothetical protein
MAKSKPFPVLQVTPQARYPHEFTISILQILLVFRLQVYIFFTHRDSIWKCVIGQAREFLIEAPGRSLAFQGVDEKMIQYFKGKSSPRPRGTGRKKSCSEELQVLRI